MCLPFRNPPPPRLPAVFSAICSALVPWLVAGPTVAGMVAMVGAMAPGPWAVASGMAGQTAVHYRGVLRVNDF